MKRTMLLLILAMLLLACGGAGALRLGSTPTATPTIIIVQFDMPTSTPEPTPVTPTPAETDEPTPSPTATSSLTPTPLPEDTATVTPASEVEPVANQEPSPSVPPAPPADTPAPEAPLSAEVDFVMRYVRLRTNEENSWDGVLGAGQCGSDHSIYVHVADAQENLLDGILIGDRFGNFEVPTGVDGPGAVRILVWSATMELSVVGHTDGTRYTSQFTPPLSTLDQDIPLDWLQQAGYCESPEDCRWRVDNNQLCRGHYSYDVIFQRTW